MKVYKICYRFKNGNPNIRYLGCSIDNLQSLKFHLEEMKKDKEREVLGIQINKTVTEFIDIKDFKESEEEQ